MAILGDAKALAQRYRELTGKPLGITGEVAEFEAARLLGLELVEARQAGYDAIRIENGKEHKLQIKGQLHLKPAFLTDSPLAAKVLVLLRKWRIR